MTPRRDEIEAGLARVRDRIAAACADAGRARDEVTLVVVTKFYPATDVRLLAELGVTDVGENRHQEAEAKAAECADLGLSWHFVGGLQSNKAAAVATLRRRRGVGRPAQAGRAALRGRPRARPHPVDVLLQVSLDPPGRERPGRRGPRRARRRSRPPSTRPGCSTLRGLMAVAPLGGDPAAAFGRLAEVRAEFLADHPARPGSRPA